MEVSRDGGIAVITIEFKFAPRQVVMILPLNLPGRVTSMRTNTLSNEYFVSWWSDGKCQDAWLDEDDLK